MIPENRRRSFPFLLCTLALLWPLLLPGLGSALPPVQRMVLPNKLVLLHSEERSLPFVTIQLLVDSGSRKDPSGQEGLANLVARGLLLGTSRRTATAINEELDFMGASLHASCGRDYAAVNFRALKKDLGRGMEIFLDALFQPAFPDEEVHRELEKTLAAIQAAEDQPEEVAEKVFRKNLFLSSPYAHPVEGTKESLPGITRGAMVQFYRTHYHPNNSILTVVGDITGEEVKAKLIPQLTKWPAGEIPEAPFKPSFASGPKSVKVDRPITQANIILGQAGVSRGNPEFYALTVMNYILGGGGFSSRLMREIRNQRGLAYSVASFFDPGKYPGSFQIVLQTKNSSAREAIALCRQEMERIRREQVSEEELEGAKKYLVGSFPMRLDTQGKLANFLTQVEYYGLGLDYPRKYSDLIRSVTREEVLRVAKTYLQPEKCILVIVANLKEAGME